MKAMVLDGMKAVDERALKILHEESPGELIKEFKQLSGKNPVDYFNKKPDTNS